MKPIRMFLIILIGMISLTAMPHTAKLEQKQKTELIKGFNAEINAVCVNNDKDILSTYNNLAFIKDANVMQLQNESKSNYLKVIVDVGWKIIKFNKNITEPLDPKSPEAIEISELIRNFVKQEAKVPYSCETCRSRCHVVGYYHAPDCPSGVGLYHVQCSSGRSYECIYLADGSVDVYPGGSTVPVPKC